MKYYITTDTHFGHQMLIDKGYRPANFNELIKKDFEKINDGDILIHLGDFTFDKTKLSNITDKDIGAVLVIGNHDSKSIAKARKLGFDFAIDSMTLRLFGKKVKFTHIAEPRVEGVDINFHGHTHGNAHRDADHEGFDYIDGYHYELALENNEYKLWDLEKLIQNIK